MKFVHITNVCRYKIYFVTQSNAEVFLVRLYFSSLSSPNAHESEDQRFQRKVYSGSNRFEFEE
jgi:hypothetical protein